MDFCQLFLSICIEFVSLKAKKTVTLYYNASSHYTLTSHFSPARIPSTHASVMSH